MKNLFSILLFLATIISFSQEVEKRKITSDQIDTIFSKWDTQDKAGIAVGILNDGKIVYTKGYGLANLEHRIPINPKTKFYIGDLAKEFTVYALLLLEQRGLLSLEDDIRKHIPKLKHLPMAVHIKQLIHHTSGLSNIRAFKALAGWRSDDVFTKEQAYTMILNQAKTIPNSGSVQRPSDAGFMILEDLIATVSKTPYTIFVSKEIFEPLGMTNSVFDTQETIISNKAQGYFYQNDGFVSSTMGTTQNIVSDVYTTVGNMCLWAKELLDPKIGTKHMIEKFDSLSVINKKNVEEVNRALYTGGHRFWNFRGTKKLYHTEVGRGYASKLIRYPDYNLAVVIMGNDGAYNGYAATSTCALYIEDFLNHSTDTPAKITSKKLSKKQLKVFEGDYWDATSHTSRKIHLVNDTLRYVRDSGSKSALVPLSKNSFKMMTWGDVRVNIDTKSVPKNMSVQVGDAISQLIEYDKNANWTKDLNKFTGKYHSEVLNTSYSLIIEDEKLVLTHSRASHVILTPKTPDLFSGDRRYFSSLEFKRDINGAVKGFQLATNGITDIWFQKEIILNKLNKVVGEK